MQRKTVYQYDKKMNLIQVHESVSAAADSDPAYNLSGISEACGKRLKTHAGYIWSYTPIQKIKKIKVGV